MYGSIDTRGSQRSPLRLGSSVGAGQLDDHERRRPGSISSGLQGVLAAHVARSELPGLVWLFRISSMTKPMAAAVVSRRGQLGVEATGTLRSSAEPMRRGTIFRISSVTKPMAAAVGILPVEEGKLSFDAPIERWLPELAGRRVLKRLDGPLDDTVPARRAITLRDLLTFRPAARARSVTMLA